MSSSKIEPRPEEIIVDATNPNIMEDLRHQVFQGQLYKFTNVVKGWQYRWFELHPETGHLEYYYYEDQGLHELVSGKEKTRKVGNKGKKEHIAGAVVVPSEEDSQTFNVNFASGESYKLRAPNVRERQIWVDRLRAVSQLHDRAIAHSNPPVTKDILFNHQDNKNNSLRCKSKSNISGQPLHARQNHSLSALDAFGSVHDILHQANHNHQKLSQSIKVLPEQPSEENKNEYGMSDIGPFCNDEDLLVLKATSLSTLAGVEDAFTLLQDIYQACQTNQCQNYAVHSDMIATQRTKNHQDEIHKLDSKLTSKKTKIQRNNAKQ